MLTLCFYGELKLENWPNTNYRVKKVFHVREPIFNHEPMVIKFLLGMGISQNCPVKSSVQIQLKFVPMKFEKAGSTVLTRSGVARIRELQRKQFSVSMFFLSFKK